MQRGMITLSKADLKQVLSSLGNGTHAQLRTTLTFGLNDASDPVAMEVSREEVETMLDLLPPPHTEAGQRQQSLRQSLEHFLHLL